MEGLKIVSLGNDFNSLSCQSWANLGASYAVADDRSSNIWNEFGNGAIPRNVIIDRDGVVRYSSIGYNESAITTLLNNLFQTTGLDDEQALPQSPVIITNFPNPFNGETQIQFDLPAASRVELTIFNSRGELIRNLVAANLASGKHTFKWNGRDIHNEELTAGIYIVKLSSSAGASSQKLLLLK